jgi:hypothetical protein
MRTVRVRNPIASTPLLRKGCVHVKTKSSQRAQVKRDVRKAVDEWKRGG